MKKKIDSKLLKNALLKNGQGRSTEEKLIIEL